MTVITVRHMIKTSRCLTARRSPNASTAAIFGVWLICHWRAGAVKALPQATQVADRWHLMEKRQPRFPRRRAQIDASNPRRVGAAAIDPDLLTAAERIQYKGYLRLEDANAAILARAEKGALIKEIVRETGYSRGLVRRVLRSQRSDVSERARVRWSRIFSGSTRNGRRALTTVRHLCGGTALGPHASRKRQTISPAGSIKGQGIPGRLFTGVPSRMPYSALASPYRPPAIRAALAKAQKTA